MSILAVMTALQSGLRDKGLSAAIDPADVNTPGAWLELDRLTETRLDGSGDLIVNVYLTAPDSDYSVVLREWDRQLAIVTGLWLPIDGDTIPVNLQLPGALVPSLRVSLIIAHDPPTQEEAP